MPLTLRLSEQARAKLTEQAAHIGQDIAAVASALIEQAVARPNVDEALAPFRKQVGQSGMTDDELDAFFEEVRERAFQERRRAGRHE
jgi:hypothetical protein